MKTLTTPAVLLTALLAAAGGGTGSPDDPLVARAAGHEFTVDEATRLLAGINDLPNDRGVVQALADLWVDYTLLAESLARDSTLRQLDLEPVLKEQFEQRMVMALRDSVIDVDTTVTEADLRARYDEGAPGERVHARHILRTWPQGATDAQKDSVRGETEDLLERIRGGADFAQLAREFSEDGSASVGGDLGWFQRGDMISTLDQAAFALEPGEVSDVVETAFGFHILRVEEREIPPFEEVAPSFRELIQTERLQHAESLYIAGLEAEAAMETAEGAAELVRELARDPNQPLSRRARNRTLMTYSGGELTVGEAQVYMSSLQPQALQSLVQAPDEVIVDNFLRGRTQRELLVELADSRGLGPRQEQRDSLGDLVLTRFREVGRALRLHPIQPTGSESREQAIARVVEEQLRLILTGAQELIPLNAVSIVLRERHDARVFPAGIEATVRALDRARGPVLQDPAARPPLPTPTPEPLPDSAGG
ncbi:MAG TPA: peptidylprolyl isomerase [Longimicrobiaceae bacterium]|nr:peptidylprolyl isomerase [Longimicrobiaceae bacterium]